MALSVSISLYFKLLINLGSILGLNNHYIEYELSDRHLIRCISNVLLHELHKLEKDHQANATLYQTCTKNGVWVMPHGTVG